MAQLADPSTPVDVTPAPAVSAVARSAKRSARRGEPVRVAGFFHRLLAAGIDVAVIFAVAIPMTFVVARLTGVRLPPTNIGITDLDLWLDMLLSGEAAITMTLVVLLAIAAVYLLVFQVTRGATLGMHLLKLRIIDWYGDTPSPAKAAVRTVGYMLCAASGFLIFLWFGGKPVLGAPATLVYVLLESLGFIGFLWIAFDSEKRGFHDLLARTYVVKI